jgi:hypothetical protein
MCKYHSISTIKTSANASTLRRRPGQLAVILVVCVRHTRIRTVVAHRYHLHLHYMPAVRRLHYLIPKIYRCTQNLGSQF